MAIYGSIMAVMLGSTGYLMFVNFVAPSFDGGDDKAPIGVPADNGFISNNNDINPADMAKVDDLVKIFSNKKFMDLKNNMVLESPINLANIGKKNPFEPRESGEGEKEATSTETNVAEIDVIKDGIATIFSKNDNLSTSSDQGVGE